jgi:integrase
MNFMLSDDPLGSCRWSRPVGERNQRQEPSMSDTLTSLDQRITVFSGLAPSRQILHYARAALAHARKIDPESIASFPSVEAAIRHDADDRVCETRDGLRWALALPAVPDGVAERVSAGSPTLADAAEVLELAISVGLAPASKRRAIGDARALARRIHKNPDALTAFPASRRAIKKTLDGLTHCDFGMSAGSYASRRSRVLFLASLLDPVRRQTLRASELPAEWAAVFEDARVLGLGGQLAKIYPIVRQALRDSLSPSDVGQSVVDEMVDVSSVKGLENPRASVGATVYAWNTLATRLPPRHLKRLTAPADLAKARGTISRRFTDLPEEVQGIWASFESEYGNRTLGGSSLASLVVSSNDPYASLAAGAGLSVSGYAPNTLRNLKSLFSSLAWAEIEDGRTPETLFDCLSHKAINNVVAAKQVAQKARATAQGKEYQLKNATLKSTLTSLITLSRIAGRDESDIDALLRLRNQLDPTIIKLRRDPRNGGFKPVYTSEKMGPLHAGMLEQFSGEAGHTKLRSFLQLPETLFKPLESKLRRNTALTAAERVDGLTAIAMAILQVCPIRRANLVDGLRIGGPDPSMSIPTDPRQPIRIRISRSETKTGARDIAAELPVGVSRRIRVYVDKIRPQVMAAVGSDPDNPFLFPAKDQNPRSGTLVLKNISERAWKRGGIQLDCHVFRHIAAKIVLDQDPSAIPLVSQILGHASIKTTLSYYAKINNVVSQRLYHAALASKIRSVFASPTSDEE